MGHELTHAFDNSGKMCLSTKILFDLQLVFSGMQSIETYLRDRTVHHLLPPEKFCCDDIML